MEDGVWRTVGGRRIFIKNGQELSDAMKESGKFGNKPKDAEKKLLIKAMKEQLEEKGVKVNDDDTVTLFHVTPEENVDKIMKDGFKGTLAPVGGMTGADIKERSFFGFDKEWVEKTWGNDGKYETMEIKVPVEYVRQGALNDKEVYIEGNIKQYKNTGVWVPDVEPTSTFYDRLALKKYKAKHGVK